MGNANNKNIKARNPRETTGSKKKLFDRKSTIGKNSRGHLERPDHLFACFNNTPPPNIDKKTGDQAAKKGIIIPLTPRELKLKLKM